MAKPQGGLKKWFGKGKGGDWVDIGAPKVDGEFQACGRPKAKVLSELTQSVCHARPRNR